MLLNEKKDVEESFEVMLIPEKETTYEGINENFFWGAGGVSINVIIMWGGWSQL